MAGIGFGTWPLGGRAYGVVDPPDAIAALERAIDRGIRLFDTADIYGDGRAEGFIGDVVPDRSEFLVITKVGYVSELGGGQCFSSDYIRRAVKNSTNRLNRRRLDVLLLHSPPESVLRSGEAFEEFDRLLEEGAIAHAGVSLRTVSDWKWAVQWANCKYVEVILNLLDQRPIDVGLVEFAHAHGMSVIARVPLCFGLLSGRHESGARFNAGDQRSRWPPEQMDAWISSAARFRFLERRGRSMTRAALAFCCGLGEAVCPIPGMKSVEQVDHNVGGCAVENALSDSEMRACREIWRELTWLPPDARSGLGPQPGPAGEANRRP